LRIPVYRLSLLYGNDRAVGGETNKYYNQYLDTPDSDGRTILYNILYQHNEMLQVSSHTVIPTFY